MQQCISAVLACCSQLVKSLIMLSAPTCARPRMARSMELYSKLSSPSFLSPGSGPSGVVSPKTTGLCPWVAVLITDLISIPFALSIDFAFSVSCVRILTPLIIIFCHTYFLYACLRVWILNWDCRRCDTPFPWVMFHDSSAISYLYGGYHALFCDSFQPICVLWIYLRQFRSASLTTGRPLPCRRLPVILFYERYLLAMYLVVTHVK